MAWIAARQPAHHHQMKLCKDEQSDQLVIGLISPSLPPTSQDANAVPSRKRHQRTLVHQKCESMEHDDDCDDLTGHLLAEKKRRLTIDQVNYLEMSFNVNLKLEPERKALIAKKLGLRPRQVAIWFQNRRARWKNKQLEQDYEDLREKYDTVLREHETMVEKHEAVVEENKRLLAEVAHLTGMIQGREIPGSVDPTGDGPAKPSPADADSDSESGSKEGQASVKSELTSPAKSDDQSEAQGSTSEEAMVAFLGQQPTGGGEISSIIACAAAVKFEAEYGALSLPGEALADQAFLFQQYPTGFHGEDLFFSWEDELHGLAWGG